MNILVPTDFSEVANLAIQYAAMLSLKLNANIILFHVVPHYSIWWPSANDELIRNAYQKQEKIKAALLKNGVDESKIEMHVFYKFPVNAWIDDFVRKNKIDFAVIGTTGTTNLTNVKMGSFALGMIEYISVPVFAVPPGSMVKNISNILYPTDLTDPLKEIKKLGVFAKAFEAFIHIVHVSKNEKQKMIDLQKLQKIATRANYKKITLDAKSGDTIEALIEESIKEKKADLLVMFPKEKSFFKKLFQGSVTDEVSHNITIPVLAIKEKEMKLPATFDA